MSRDDKRSTRVGESIRAELMNILLRGQIRDPGAKDVLVSAVRLSDDLRHARVYVRTLDEASEPRRRAVVDAMTRAAGFLRREIGQHLRLRHVPDLRFYWDDVVDTGLRMESLLSEISDESKSEGEGEP